MRENFNFREALKFCFEPMIIVPCALSIGLVGVLIFSFSNNHTLYENFSTFALLGMFSGACSVFGGAIGFLFGVPKSSVNNEENGNNGIIYSPNTNLENISDWLSKIILGAGLTQLIKLPDFIEKITSRINSYNPTLTQDITTFSFVYFLIAGFFFGYLWSRIDFQTLLRKMEDAFYEQKSTLTEQDNKIKELINDNESISIIEKHLSELEDSEDLGVLKSCIMSASNVMATEIFRKARRVRRGNWKSNNHNLVDRTTPIFEYLIERDISLNSLPSHKNYAQLGYALMRQSQPDIPRAYENLNIAIKYLGNLKLDNDDKFIDIYKLNRCLCAIILSSHDDDHDYKKVIKDDLSSIKSARIIDMIYSDINYQTFRDWSDKAKIPLPPKNA